MLQIKQLNKKFGKKSVLENVSYTFEHQVYGLLGPNGSGKTTLMRCMTLLYAAGKKTIFYQGKAVGTNPEYLDQIGYLPQQFGLFKELQVHEMMQLMANYKGIEKKAAEPMIEKSVKMVNLYDRMDSKVGALSGGMIRRLGIAQAILNEPEIIIFDEPTAGLDPEERLRFKDTLSQIKEGRTIIISTHIVEDVEAVCDTVAIMKDKKIAVSGSLLEIQQHASGKVFQVTEESLSGIDKQYYIQKHLEVNGTKEVRILSNSITDIPPVQPTVEDGYICIIKNI